MIKGEKKNILERGEKSELRKLIFVALKIELVDLKEGLNGSTLGR